jgi:dTDP-4-amino-4,6-dideoxygalactose transaminase
MIVPFVDLKRQYHSIKEEIDGAIGQVLEEADFIGGKYPLKFEKEFAEKYGVKHCVSVANGTDAIYITLKMLGIGKGDEVITTACSWISTSETISQTGATPVFVDIDDYFLIDSTKIEAKITSKTKAILPVHLYGQMADINHIEAIAKKHNLLLIEDCAQAHFAELDNKRAGLTGIAGTFSFYPGKNLGAYGDAGCILTDDDEIALKARQYANHGGIKKHQHDIEGINSRMDSLQAAVLSVKLPYIDQWTTARQEVAALYFDLLQNIPQIILPKVKPNSNHVFHLFVIEAEQRTDLQTYLKENGIDTAIHYPTPLPFLNCYKHLKSSTGDFPLASNKQTKILSLPIYPEITEIQTNHICTTIKEFFGK